MQTHRNAALPLLGWLAEVDVDCGLCRVEHGALVEIDPSPAGPQWAAAAIWEGPFEQGGFHRAPHTFGSGVRIVGEEVHFVPSSTTIDRIFYLRRPSGVVVSNSLVVLLSRLGARLHPAWDHRGWGEGVCMGRLEFLGDVVVTGSDLGAVRQQLYESLVVGPAGVRFEDRTASPPTFDCYGDYVGALSASLDRLWRNATDSRRQRPSRAVSTASRGYDSPAVTALVTKLTAVDCYSAARSSTRVPLALRRFVDSDLFDDDGTAIAAHLGATPLALPDQLQELPAAVERWLWASAEVSPELIFWRIFIDAAATDELTIWFAGHNGDIMWDLSPMAKETEGTLYRGAPSGVSLAEARLKFGLIDCSVPFIHARSVASVHGISRSAELGPWRLGNTYDRPVPRRLLEDRGVPRQWFGFGKKMVAQDFESPQGRELRAEFLGATGWTNAAIRAYRGVNLGLYGAARTSALLRCGGSRSAMLERGSQIGKATLSKWSPVLALRRATFVHCVDTLADELAACWTAPG